MGAAVTVVSLGNGMYRVDSPAGHSYAEEGSYTVTVTAQTGGSLSGPRPALSPNT